MNKLVILVVSVTSLALIWNPASADNHAMFSSQSLTPEIALKAVNAALKSCRDDGYQVAVAVVDRAGVTQALVRDRYAGAHTVDTARRKAWTAASFRTDTVEIVQFVEDNPQQAGILQIGEAMIVGGGRTIEAGGSLVGAIGVSGGPNGDIDDSCAQAGIAAIEFDIQF
jgi:uncharacterized protein GlcG (DUF336 family)